MSRWAAVPAFVVALCATRLAQAERAELLLLPVSTQPATPVAPGARTRGLTEHAETLSEVLADAAYDEGFEVRESSAPPGAPPSDEALTARAQEGWVLSPYIEASGSKVLVKLVAVAKGSRVLLVRSERMDPSRIEVRAVVMLRDLVGTARGPAEAGGEVTTVDSPQSSDVGAPRSSGRAVLALNAALFGGYIGFSLQKASGSEDERLIYPLAALGAGIGLGASLLVADEWDVSVGDAWFVAAGGLWPAAAGLLLAKSYDVASEDRYVYGIVGASAGVAAATAAVAVKPMSEGGATIAHSGGAFGLGLGGLTELLVRGNTEEAPLRGMGFGAIGGVVLGGALATQVDLPTSRVLLNDLGASLGALGGAAAASPLLLVEEEEHPTRTRLWLSSIALGTIAGGTVAWWVTRNSDGRASLPVVPYAYASPVEHGGAAAELGVLGQF